MKIVNENGVIINPIYKIGEETYQVIATRSVGYSVWDSIDTIKKLSTGELKEFSRKKLYNNSN